MDITPLVPKERLAITGYGAGYFTLNGERTDGSIFLHGGTVQPWNEALNPADLGALLGTLALDLVIFGSGKEMRPCPPDIRAWLKSKNIGVEMMDTGAACRTYNVLMAEERRVAAFLMAVD